MSKIVYIPHVDQYGKVHAIGNEFVTVDLLGDFYGTRTCYNRDKVKFLKEDNLDTVTTKLHVLDKDIAELFERQQQLERRIEALIRVRNDL